MNAVLFLGLLAGQCGPNGCYITPTIMPVAHRYEWKRVKEWVALMDHGVQIGAYEPTQKIYRPFHAGVFYNPTALPDGAPPPPTEEQVLVQQEASKFQDGVVIDKDGLPNFGIEKDKISKKNTYSINGKPVSREAALEAVEKGSLEDDSWKLSITAIGTEAECKPVRDAVAASKIKDSVHYKEYRPDDPMVKDSGFKADGHPTIYLQKRDGKVVARGDTFTGIAPIERRVEAAREKNAAYDPARDPPLESGLPDLKSLPTWVWAIVAFVVAFFTGQRQPAK